MLQLGQMGGYSGSMAITVHAPDAITADHDARVLTEAAARRGGSRGCAAPSRVPCRNRRNIGLT